MRIGYSEFIKMTWAQFIYAYQGFTRESFRQRMEGARLVSYITAAINRDPKKNFPKSPEEWMKFPTDPEQREQIDEKEWARQMRARMKLAEIEHKRKYG